MRFFLIFPLFIMVISVCAPSVQAQEAPESKGVFNMGSDFKKLIWGHPNTNFLQPHLNDAKTPHSMQFHGDGWSPEVWAENAGGAEKVMGELYYAGIITDQYKDDVPVLEVGRPFLQLSQQDQQRVTAFVDYVYGITTSKPQGMYYVLFKEKRIKKIIGVYSEQGLQLQ